MWVGVVPSGEAEKPLPLGQSWGAWGSASTLPRRWVMAPPWEELTEWSGEVVVLCGANARAASC